MNAHLTAKVTKTHLLIIHTAYIISGLTALIALGILDAMEEQGKIKSLLEMDFNGVEYLHTLVETLRYVILPLNWAYLFTNTYTSRLAFAGT